MKKRILTLSLAILTIAGTTSLTSCKKGENDPFMSLRSRKSRLAGDWTLDSGNGRSTSTSSGTTSSSSYTISGGIATINYEGSSYSFPYTVKFTIEKDNSFERVTNEDGDITTEKGNWAFANKNKDQDLKNKEAIVLNITSVTDEDGTSTYTGASADEILVIDQLKNKEIIFKSENSYTSSGYSSSSTSEMTYVQ